MNNCVANPSVGGHDFIGTNRVPSNREAPKHASRPISIAVLFLRISQWICDQIYVYGGIIFRIKQTVQIYYDREKKKEMATVFFLFTAEKFHFIWKIGDVNK